MIFFRWMVWFWILLLISIMPMAAIGWLDGRPTKGDDGGESYGLFFVGPVAGHEAAFLGIVAVLALVLASPLLAHVKASWVGRSRPPERKPESTAEVGFERF